MKKFDFRKIWKYKISEYIFTFAAVTLVFIACMKLGIKNDEIKTAFLMAAALIAVGVYMFCLYRKKSLTAGKVIQCVVICGMIMRAGYMIYTHMFTRGHDLGAFDITGDGADGHLSYIMNLAKNNSLPPTNENQFYHPPLFHFLASLFVRLGTVFYPEDFYKAFEYAQIVNCAASCFMLTALKNFLGELELKEKYQIYALAITAFFPNLYFMGGRLNNDMLSVFFMLLCVINTYRWYKKRDMKTMIFLALSFGLGMMSKISCGSIAIFTAPVMLYCLFKEIRSKNMGGIKAVIIQLFVFALICFPLALWYPVRNYLLFEQPLDYVHYLGKSSFVYTGNIPWYKRFFEFSVPRLFGQPFANVGEDYSIPMYIMRTSIFGEFKFDKPVGIIWLLISANLLVIAVSFVSAVFVLKSKKIKKEYKIGLTSLWIILMLSYLSFNAGYPFMCTADFRYILLTEAIGAVFIGYAAQLTDEKKTGIIKIARIVINTAVIGFCAGSVLMFL